MTFTLDPGFCIGVIWAGYFAAQIILISIHRFPQRNLSYRPLTSVIIASWREGLRVRKCLESLFAQRYPIDKIEIVVIGGGDPESVEILSKFESEGKIRFIERRDKSPKWESVNIGIENSKGDVLAFIDADCVAPPDWIERLNENFEGKIMGVVGYAVPSSSSNFISKAHWISFPALIFSMIALRFPVHCGACSAFKREAFTVYGMRFRDSFVEDLLFTLEARRKGVKFVFDRHSCVMHAFPISLREYDKGVKRIVTGMMQDLKFHPMIFFNVMLPIVSILYFAVNLASSVQQPLSFSISPVSAAISALTAAYVILIMRRLGIKKFSYLPHFFVLSWIASMLYFKNVLRFLLRQETQWVIYQKA